MAYKTELHCHSKPMSICAEVDPAHIVKTYVAAGYTSLVLTNHINGNFAPPYAETDEWLSNVRRYLQAYHDLKEEAKGKLHILLGAELCPDIFGYNDLLMYGITEEFLLAAPHLRRCSLEELSALMRKNGFLFAIAHPFRNNITMRDPALFDGIEVYNGHSHHNSRNFLARTLAEKTGLIPLSGTDYHHLDQPVTAGIETEEPITDNATLLRVLRSGNYTLIKNTEIVED